MKKWIFAIVICICMLSIPTVGAVVTPRDVARELIEMFRDRYETPEDFIPVEELYPTGLFPDESECNTRLVYCKEIPTTYLLLTTRIWKLNPKGGENWYIISGQIDAINDKVRAKSITVEIFVWDRYAQEDPQYRYPEYKFYGYQGNDVMVRGTYEPIQKPNGDPDGKEDWVEDLKVGTLSQERDRDEHWGYVADSGRYDLKKWNMFSGQTAGWVMDFRLWKDDYFVRYRPIQNFEGMLLVGGDNLNFDVRYIWEDVGGQTQIHESFDEYIWLDLDGR